MQAVPSAQELEAIMLQLTVANTAQIKHAETQLKAILKNPASVPAFFEQLQRSQHIHARQMAAILLRKKINGHWPNLDANAQTAVKQALISVMTTEPESIVQKAAASLIAALSKHVLAQGQWPELLQFIQQCTQSTEDQHRYIAMLLLWQLTETVGEHLQSQFDALKVFFSRSLQDPNPKVRTTGLKAVGALIDFLSTEDEVVKFRDLVPAMIEAVKQVVAEGDEELAVEMFEIFGELAQSPQQVLTSAMVPVLVKLLLEVATKENLETGTRDASILCLNSVIASKPKTVGKAALTPMILQAMLHICAQSSAAAGDVLGDEEEEELDEDTPFRMAQSCLDVLAIHVSTKHVFQPALQLSAQYISGANANQRKAGAMCLGVIAEGCSEPMKKHLNEMLTSIYTLAQDGDAVVREAACFCLGQWSEHLQPEILEHHSAILPVVFQLLADGQKQVQGTSCYVLECFCQNLESDNILPFLQELMERLVLLLQTGRKQVQEMAIAAISATAVAAEEEFLPYFQPVIQMMKMPLQATEEDQFPIRGRSLECVGHMAIAVGRDAMSPHLMECMNYAMQGLLLEDSELAEFTFAFFCNIAKVFEQEFDPFLQQLVPRLVDAGNTSDGAIIGEAAEEEVGGFSDDDDDEDGDGRITLSVRTALLDAKAGAIEALGSLAEFTGPKFVPYLDVSLDVMNRQVQSLLLAALESS
jgi:hypothetical protein